MTRALAAASLALVATVSSACVVDAEGRRAEGTFSRTLSVSGPVRIEVETGSGGIAVRAGDVDEVRVEGRVSAGWSLWDGGDAEDRVRAVEAAPPIEQSGNDIHVGGGSRTRRVRISYLLTIPRRAELRLRTGSGDVTVGDVDGLVRAEAGSGDVRIGRVSTDVRVRTGSGDVEVEAAEGVRVTAGSGDVMVGATGRAESELTTGSGDVALRGASGPLRVRTGSGSIHVAGAPTASWELSAGSGDIALTSAPTAAFSVDATSSSGDVHVQGVVSERIGRHTIRGNVRGGGPKVSLSTGSGRIDVR